jgi:hypothetical protein
MLVWWWCGAAIFFVSLHPVGIRFATVLLRLLLGSVDAVVFILRLLRLAVVWLVSVGVDLLRPILDLLFLPRWPFFFSILRFLRSLSYPPW